MKRLLFFSLFLASFHNAYGEIENVTLRWTVGICSSGCIRDLNARFSDTKEIIDPVFSEADGQVSFRWSDKYPFSFSIINTITRLVGVRVRETQMTVSGKLAVEGKRAFVLSTGDGTRFEILSPVTPNTTQQVITQNVETHRLSQEQLERLKDAQAEGKIAVISGRLFQPFRAPPYQIVTANTSFKEPQRN